MILFGLTGGIATGKSTVSRYISDELQIPVIDADKIARDVVQIGRPAYKRIVKYFPECIDKGTGEIDRAALGARVFGDQEARKCLNRCTHPSIRYEIFKQIILYWWNKCPLVVLDAPLLFESRLHMFMNKTICVYCPPDAQLGRLMKRNGYTETEAKERINSQMPIEEKCRLADIVVDNGGTIESLHEQISRVFESRLTEKVSLFSWLLWPIKAAMLVIMKQLKLIG